MMQGFRARALGRMAVGVSALALGSAAFAQDAASTMGQPGPSQTQPTVAADPATDGDTIVVTGIRASLRESVDIKREAQGVVDAISAEDIGKFPDTNLAESLQRITGVSIDRSNGEGSTVTVRGFGPEFNLVTLNGRQMPTSSLGDGGSAPSGRSFDFANLASEGISAVEVYKTGRASIPSGGIGSSINIRTPRPLDKEGFRGSVAAKGVYDTSRNFGHPVTPEVSGIASWSNADGNFGVLITGIYQQRKSSFNQANVGWRDGYLGNENNWGSLPPAGSPNVTNHPKATDVYEVQQNASYDINDVNRKRINGQLVLQYKPAENLTATADFTYSRNEVEQRNSNVGVWFNFGDTTSAWTDGPVAGPVFYTERFAPPTVLPNGQYCLAPVAATAAGGVCANANGVAVPNAQAGKDLSYSGSLTKVRTENKSTGFNLNWEGQNGLTLALDAHHSTAESKPTNKYGSNTSVGTAIFGIASQTINYDKDLPVISYTFPTGINPLNPALITPTGNAFRTAYFKDRINQVQLKGHYDHDGDFLDAIDFGFSYIDNKVRSAFGVVQNDTWGGVGPASAVPDDIFHLVSLPDKFKGIDGAGSTMIQSFYAFDYERMVALLDKNYGICGGDGDCTAPFTTDRRITERTLAPYLQASGKFEAFGNDAHITAGLRYEQTTINSAALVPTPTQTAWVSDNEFNVITPAGSSSFTRFKGSYQNWLPAIDFDISPTSNIKLRASYSHTITRPDYASLQGGRTLDQLFRIGGGTGAQGNPGLLPYKSKNIDLSAEWYYTRESYISVGFFHKDVSNFLSSTVVNTPAFGLTNPANGPRYRAAVAALGATATATQIRNYIAANYPNTVAIVNNQLYIFGQPDDAPVNFQITTPFNGTQTAKLYGFEFAIQHRFWDTGFGTILNYTKVNGDAKYDNTKPATVSQFALTGLSDSANAVLYYDKNGLQARIAYNWRDQFLAGTGPNPFYTEAYGQFDASASYAITPMITVFAEAINLTGADRRGHRRSDRNVTFVSTGDARYAAGVRLTF